MGSSLHRGGHRRRGQGIEKEELSIVDHLECVDADGLGRSKRLRDWVLRSGSGTVKVESRKPLRLIDAVRFEIEDEKS